MDKIYYEWMSKLTIMFVNKIGKNYYDIITTDINISKRDLSKAMQGEDLRIRYYIKIIAYIMDWIQLKIDLGILLIELRKVLNDKHELLIATVPRKKNGIAAPEHWSVLIKWR